MCFGLFSVFFTYPFPIYIYPSLDRDPRANRGRTVTILPDRGGSPSGKADGLGSHGSMSESSVTDSMSEPKFSGENFFGRFIVIYAYV